MKKIILVPALLGVMGIGGIIAVAGGEIVGSADTSKVLTKSQIEKKVLAEVDGKITEIDFDKEGLISLYEVEVVTSEAEYDLKFDAFTGELLKKKIDEVYTVKNAAKSTTTTKTSASTNTSTKSNSTMKDNNRDDWEDDDRYDDLDDLDDLYDDDDRYDD